jgi:hypothetical protein
MPKEIKSLKSAEHAADIEAGLISIPPQKSTRNGDEGTSFIIVVSALANGIKAKTLNIGSIALTWLTSVGLTLRGRKKHDQSTEQSQNSSDDAFTLKTN